MVKTLLVSFLFLLNPSFQKEDPEDFDHEISSIARKFKAEIMDKDECERQKREAGNLADEIESALSREDDYSPEERSRLKILMKEAEALEEYIAAVGDCGNYSPNKKSFQMANRRVGGSVATVSKGKYCVEIITVTIDGYVAYLAENKSANDYSVAYKWKSPNGMSSGHGSMGLFKSSLRHIYDNRAKPSQKNVSVFAVTCKELSF